MIRIKDLENFMRSKEIRTIYHNEVEYINEIIKRLRAWDKLISCPRPKESNVIDTTYLTEWIKEIVRNRVTEFGQEYCDEIVARLRELDKLRGEIKSGQIK